MGGGGGSPSLGEASANTGNPPVTVPMLPMSRQLALPLNQAVPSRVGATLGLMTPVSRASGYCRRSARKAGVAMTVSPIRLGQKTTIFMRKTCSLVTPLTTESRLGNSLA